MTATSASADSARTLRESRRRRGGTSLPGVRPASAALTVLLALGAEACRANPSASRKPTRDCIAARRTLDHALGLRDFARARSLRATAYGACGDRPELRERDQRIIDGESQRALASLAAAERRQAAANLAQAFLEFVAKERAAPEHASAAPRCAAIPGPPGTRSGAVRWCTATRHLGQHALEIRYDESAPQAFRFTITVDGPLTCADVGGAERRRWPVKLPTGAAITRARCALGPPLDGLTAVVSRGEPSTLLVVSPSYLEQDPGSRAILDP